MSSDKMKSVFLLAVKVKKNQSTSIVKNLQQEARYEKLQNRVFKWLEVLYNKKSV
jgi:hypothetical protein